MPPIAAVIPEKTGMKTAMKLPPDCTADDALPNTSKSFGTIAVTAVRTLTVPKISAELSDSPSPEAFRAAVTTMTISIVPSRERISVPSQPILSVTAAESSPKLLSLSSSVP